LANPFRITTDDAWPKCTGDLKSITTKMERKPFMLLPLLEKQIALTGHY